MSPNLFLSSTRYGALNSILVFFLFCIFLPSVQSLRRGIEVHSLNHVLLDLSLANQFAEELGSLFALALDLDCLVALLVEILDAVVEANAQVVGGHAQDGAHSS